MSKVLITENSLQNIANAIRDKNGLSDTYTPSEMAQAIEDIPTGGGKVAPQYVSFYTWMGQDLDISWLDWKNLEKTKYMFYGCSQITAENWAKITPQIKVTSKNTDVSYMFYNCPKLSQLDVSNWDTSNVQSFQYTFRSASGEGTTYYGFSSIEGLDSFDMRNVTNVSNMFCTCNLQSSQWAKLKNWKFNKVTSFNNMFSYARIPGLDLSNWDYSEAPVKSLASMFSRVLGGSSTQTIQVNLSGLCTNKITDLSNLFYGNTIYANIDFSNWDTSNVTTMASMFSKSNSYTGKLETLDLSSFHTPKLTTTSQMFYNCTNTTRIDMRNFDFSNITNHSNMFGSGYSSGPPNDCLIIVADDTQKNWITSKFTRLTNVKTVAELGE